MFSVPCSPQLEPSGNPRSLTLHLSKPEIKGSKRNRRKTLILITEQRELSPLEPGDRVWVSERGSEAEVHEEVSPLSLIKAEGGTLRWNRQSLIRLPNSETVDSSQVSDRDVEPIKQSIESNVESHEWNGQPNGPTSE